VTAITPATGAHNKSVPVTITGTGLTGATAVHAGGGITVSNIVVSNFGTTLTANFTIANGATLNARNVTVATPIGITPVNPVVTFTVQ
jgi:hypothetical protein